MILALVPDEPYLSPGAVVAGKYRVGRTLGQGGMGVVVEAWHLSLQERVALKFLLPEVAWHAQATSRFLREARTAAKIRSEHVARVVDVDRREDGTPYMVMEFLEGSNLAERLAQSGVGEVGETIDFVIQACDGIAEAHARGIVHRDVKPANLFLTRRADGSPLVKVLDFGIAKILDAAAKTLSRTVGTLGSPYYMSPEQLVDSGSVDHRTDVYSLGVTLYELLSGTRPFSGRNYTELMGDIMTGEPASLHSLRPEVPASLSAAIARAFARDAASRYGSIAELAGALAPHATAATKYLSDRIVANARREETDASDRDAAADTVPHDATPPLVASPLERFQVQSVHTLRHAGDDGADQALAASVDAAHDVVGTQPTRAWRASVVKVWLVALAGGAVIGAGFYLSRGSSRADLPPVAGTAATATESASATAPARTEPVAAGLPSATASAAPEVSPSVPPSATASASPLPRAPRKQPSPPRPSESAASPPKRTTDDDLMSGRH